MNLFSLLRRRRKQRYPSCHRTCPRLEALEARVVPYAASGNFWPQSNLITLSFQPDGTNLGGVSSNLFAQFNAAFGSTAAWQNVILRAAQTWAAQTNMNLAVITDNGADSGSGAYQQGSTDFGDIRIGGFGMQGTNALALGYMPPTVNNYSVAGDIAFNTNQIFNINGLDYDLYSVALHEFGHAFGLDHSSTTSAVMYSTYQGAQSGLYADDIAGIRSIYSQGNARSADAYDAAASNSTFATASNLTASIDGTTHTALLTALDVTTTSDLDYYKFTVPQGAASTAQIVVQSQGLSLLAPSLRVYNGSQSLIASSTGSGDFGSTLTINLTNVSAGQVYYVRVTAANTTVFGVGTYALGLNLAGGTAPTASPPNTQLANGDPLNGGGGVANRKDENGVSINLLLGQTLGTVQYAVGSLGLGLLNPWISRIGGLLAPLGKTTVEVPFADLLVGNSRPDSSPADTLAPDVQRHQELLSQVERGTSSVRQLTTLVGDPLLATQAMATIPNMVSVSGVSIPLVVISTPPPMRLGQSIVKRSEPGPHGDELIVPSVVPVDDVDPTVLDQSEAARAAACLDFSCFSPSTCVTDYVFTSEDVAPSLLWETVETGVMPEPGLN